MNQRNNADDILAVLGKRNVQAHKQSRRFLQLFGLRLTQFWHPLTGFDIVAFDDVIKPDFNQSLHDYVQTRYGPEAVQLIADLIGLPIALPQPSSKATT
jgi:hypothetical protein